MNKLLAITITLLFLPYLSFAQIEKTENDLNCNDYSVVSNLSINVAVEKTSLTAGDDVEIKGQINNKGKTDISNIDVLIKVIKKDSKGDFLVDQFYVVEDKYIKSITESNFNFLWKVPSSYLEGRYELVPYLSQNHVFDNNDFITLNSDIFPIVNIRSNSPSESPSNEMEYVGILKDSLKLNGKNYSESISFDKNKLINISFKIKNFSNHNSATIVNIGSYNNVLGSESNALLSETKHILLKPSEEKEITFTDKSFYLPITNVRVSVNTDEAKSMLNFNLTRSQDFSSVITRIGLLPISYNNIHKNEVFICLKTNNKIDKNSNLIINIVDEDNIIVFNRSVKLETKEGEIGFKFPLVLDKNYNKLNLLASVENNGTSITRFNATYQVPAENSFQREATGDRGEGSTAQKMLFIVITMLVFLQTAIYFISHKKKTSPNE